MGFISPLKALQAASRTIVPCRYAPGSSRRETLFAATIVIAAGVVQPAEAAVPDHILHIQQPHENQIIDPSHAVYASAETAAAARQGASSAAAANSNCSKLDPVLASAFVAAVDKVVQQQGILPEEQLQRERYKLQQQEYKYYLAANKERMPQLPELADNSGGLSNRLYFNFVSYILWKVVAKNLGPDSEKRTAFCAAVGEALLVDMLPDIVKLVTAAAQGDAHQAPAAVLIPALRDVLNHLQQHGYLCSYQLVWDSQPGSWPADWAVSQQQVVGPEQLLEQQAPLAQGTIFQVKLQRPADIEGSVALRAEEDGFWSRHISSMLAALLRTGGYKSAAVDEYFYQDYWQGPASTLNKVLLLLGDPLDQVEVPWTPTTLVQDWVIQ